MDDALPNLVGERFAAVFTGVFHPGVFARLEKVGFAKLFEDRGVLGTSVTGLIDGSATESDGRSERGEVERSRSASSAGTEE